MRIVLNYKDGEVKELRGPYGMRGRDGSRPIRARVCRCVKRGGYVWNKILMGLDPEYRYDIGYFE